MAKCSECNTKLTDASEATKHCPPLEQRRGPSLDSPSHPANSGAWARIMAVPMCPSGPHGPYGVGGGTPGR